MPNLDLLVDALAHIECEPQTWDQGSWAKYTAEGISEGPIDVTLGDCGTAGCLAGWAATLSGLKPKWNLLVTSFINGKPYQFWGAETVCLPDGTHTTYETAATDLFGLETPYVVDDHWCKACDGEGHSLYQGDNSKEELYELSSLLFNIPQDELHLKVDARVSELLLAEEEFEKAQKEPKPVPSGT